MIGIVLAGAIAALGMSPSLAEPQRLVHQAQFRGSPDGECPRGYDFNYSNGRCYPNDYHAPGAYARGGCDADERVYRRGRYGACPRGYDFNYSNGRCYPNGTGPPGLYARYRLGGERQPGGIALLELSMRSASRLSAEPVRIYAT